MLPLSNNDEFGNSETQKSSWGGSSSNSGGGVSQLCRDWYGVVICFFNSRLFVLSLKWVFDNIRDMESEMRNIRPMERVANNATLPDGYPRQTIKKRSV